MPGYRTGGGADFATTRSAGDRAALANQPIAFAPEWNTPTSNNDGGQGRIRTKPTCAAEIASRRTGMRLHGDVAEPQAWPCGRDSGQSRPRNAAAMAPAAPMRSIPWTAHRQRAKGAWRERDAAHTKALFRDLQNLCDRHISMPWPLVQKFPRAFAGREPWFEGQPTRRSQPSGYVGMNARTRAIWPDTSTGSLTIRWLAFSSCIGVGSRRHHPGAAMPDFTRCCARAACAASIWPVKPSRH